ncbi:DUF302 domain-containing protein [Rubrobacter taiwanensis]|uniref:DUF302 domain-containing protein n=1 Tax=Rubrobacter taiwanensis TaxID=185139 RepID=A0A4R1BIA4_9ACTN|nr:DUF302 domain-containing protein [Rubrobacter taiwanensis]
MKVRSRLSAEEAEARVRESLAGEGFSVLTEIDVAATLKEKLGVERPFYKILGACNPHLASEALDAEEDVGLLLPCNVVVYEAEGGSVVAALDPGAMGELAASPDLEPLMREARSRVERSLAAVEE